MDEWINGRRWETNEILRIVKEAAHTPLGKYLHFSGGSRFDDEFRIRVDPSITTHLHDAPDGLRQALP